MTALRFSSEQILTEAVRIARIPAPPGAEGSRAATVVELVRDAGWAVRLDDVGNVLASPAPVEPSGAVWVLIHLDTVFEGDTSLEFMQDGHIARGPGIGDNAVAIAAGLALVRAFEPQLHSRSLVVAFTVGEESHGNLRGARNVLENHGASDAYAVVAVEGHRGDELGIEMVGSVRFTLSVTSEGGHSWWDRGRRSATHELIHFSHELLQEAESVCPEVAVNIGVISGGTGVTAIAAEGAISFEGRASDAAAISEFAGLVKRLSGELPLPHRLVEIGRRPGGVLPSDHWLVAQAQRARTLAGLEEARFGSSSSDANPFAASGIPAITVGITTGRNAHQLDEEIDVAPIAAGTSALFLLVDLLTH